MDQRDSHCPYSLSSEITAKPTVLGFVLMCLCVTWVLYHLSIFTDSVSCFGITTGCYVQQRGKKTLLSLTLICYCHLVGMAKIVRGSTFIVRPWNTATWRFGWLTVLALPFYSFSKTQTYVHFWFHFGASIIRLSERLLFTKFVSSGMMGGLVLSLYHFSLLPSGSGSYCWLEK